MSSKQLRKLRELQGTGEGDSAQDQQAACEEDEAEVEEGSGNAPRRPAFAALCSDSESESAPEEGSGCAANAASSATSTSRAATCEAAAQGDEGSKKGRARRRKAAGRGPKAVVDQNEKDASAGAEGEEESDEELKLLESSLQEAQAERDAFGDDAEVGAASAATGPCKALPLRRADFSMDNERRRVIGGSIGVGADTSSGPRSRRTMTRQRGGAEGRIAHHRRLFLVTPTAEEPWARPDDCIAMTADSDGFGAAIFDFEDTPQSSRLLEQLRECLQAQDPNLLQHFLQRNQFCVDGLLTLADYLRGQSSHEQAFQIVRRAVYALECNFNPAFSPFSETGVGPAALRPRVALKLSGEAEWPGWSWLRALWLYMRGLANQGMHRTALEVCKLLLAATLPRDPTHSLPYLDFLCLRSRQFDALSAYAELIPTEYGLVADGSPPATARLDLALPSFAYSVALAGFMKAGSAPDLAALNEVCIADVTEGMKAAPGGASEELSAAAVVHVRMMRALLVFPLALRPLLDEAGVSDHGSAPGGSSSRVPWGELLGQPPFSDAADFRHEAHGSVHGRLCLAYAKRCGALWRADLSMRWLHSCAARLVSMHASSVFAADLSAARQCWRCSPLCVEDALRADYGELATEEGQTPPAFERAIQARLHPPRENAAFGPGGLRFGGQVAGGAERVAPTISLHSPPLLVFFQSLLPWAELDVTGVGVEPLGWSDVGRNMLQVARSTLHFFSCLAQDAVFLLGQAARKGWAVAREAMKRRA